MSSLSEERSDPFVDRNRPELPLEPVRAFAASTYGLSGEFLQLPSERDQNYRITGESGACHVLKISAADELNETIARQIAFLEHLRLSDPEVSVPRVVETTGGAPMSSIAAPTGEHHVAHCLTYLPGRQIEQLPLSRALLNSIGTSLAHMNRAARGFHPGGIVADLPWHIHSLPRLAPCLGHVRGKELHTKLTDIVTHFETSVQPVLRHMRSQTIHQDVNAPNILLDPENPDTVSGIIDFGDMVHTTVICDIAVSGADLCAGADMVPQVCEIASAFDVVLPLEAEEVDLLYDLMCARVAATLLIIAVRNDGPSPDGYMADQRGSYEDRLEVLLTLGREQTCRALRRACGFPVRVPGRAPDAISDMIERRHKSLGSALSLSYGDNPVHVEAGEGIWLLEADGTRLLDCYNNVPHVGHAHPHVARAVARQTSALNTNTRYLFGAVLDYAERLAALAPAPLDTCTFVNSGSEANDIAYRMARYATGNSGVIVTDYAWHGITAATAPFAPHGRIQGIDASHIATIVAPDPYRGPYKAGDGDLAALYAADAERAVAELEASGHGVAAFMIDSAFTSDGVPDVPEGYLKRVVDTVRAAGGVIIADEVQCGLGRIGTHFWGFDAHGIAPDMITLGKPVGNGYPLGVVISVGSLRDAFGNATDYFSTFGGNPVACAAGAAVLDVIEREDLQENARLTGEYKRHRLADLAQRHALIGDVRGTGLLTMVELVRDRATREPAARETSEILKHVRGEHVLVGSEGPHSNVLKIRPPMVFSRDNADQLVDVLDRVLRDLPQ